MSYALNGSVKSRKNPGGRPYVNPFIYELVLDNPFDVIKTGILTVTLMPVRIILICLFLLISWGLSCIGLFGLSPAELSKKPLCSWRRFVQKCVALSMRAAFAAGSFHYITYKGTPASPKEAPILCVAPHSSFADAIVVVVLGPPSIVAKAEAAELPFFGKIINYTQPIYVFREDPSSRKRTIREIVDRANSEANWPQILIFPEGTCTNRSALITFKQGAFYPGVPVQPVLLKYPNALDAYTWTWEGPGALKLIWLTLTRVYSNCEIEFLPVYKPSEAEKANPILFANNVRDVMARALGVPVSDFTYDDCKTMTTAKEMCVPYEADIVEIDKIRKTLGLNSNNIDEYILRDHMENLCTYLTLEEFAEKLRLDHENDYVKELFAIFDSRKFGAIDLKDYLLCSYFLIRQSSPIIDFLWDVTRILTCEVDKKLLQTEFYSIIKHAGKISPEHSNNIYTQIAQSIGERTVKFSNFVDFIEGKPQYSYLLKSIDGKLKKQ